MGRVQSVTDFGGRTVSMTYDHMGRTVTRTDAAGTVSNAYDAVGNLTSVTDERGKTTTPLWRGFPTTPLLRPQVTPSFRVTYEGGDLWSKEWPWSGDHATAETMPQQRAVIFGMDCGR
ncbi:MAG: RHS repeat protein [Candidatus Hydrogenedentes bacterium]|nr:RHS repeat protein [Candidatus Hydrogenedentota bacterium]